MWLPGHELGVAETYLYDDFDIAGNIEAVFGLAEAVAAATSGWRKRLLAAIHDATGIWMDELPVTPERMWRAAHVHEK